MNSAQPEGRLAISFSNRAQQDIQIWRQGVADEVASDLRVEIGPRLYEETAYSLLVRGKDNRQVELRHRDPIILQNLYPSGDGSIVYGSINFRSQIGLSRFSVYVDGKVEYDFEVEVFPSKLDYAADYNVLLADIQDILAGLVLEYLRSTFKLGFATDSDNPSRLEWILLLRNVVEDLERGLRYVERHPYHNLVGERVATRVEKLRRPDATISRLAARGKGRGPRSRTASGRELHGRLPERRARMTWDAPEHRWLSCQLTRIRQTLAEIHLAERKNPTQNKLRQARILAEIAELENRIAALQGIEPIAHAKGFAPAGFTSLTLQSKPGYREAYRACLVLLQGLRVDGGPVGLSVKDIHRLYEYWCYLAVMRIVAKITGEPVPVRQLFSVEPDGLRVRLKRGESHTVKFASGDRTLELTYNPKYSGDAFILPQQPDLVLTFRDPPWSTMRLVFDAKYRINTNPGYLKHFRSPGPPQDAIDALHRYRDAILEETGVHGARSDRLKHTVVEGVALFPHADTDDQFRSSRLWSSLEQVGIGAIPFLPRETRYLEEWLRKVLRRGGWSTAERTIPYLSLEQLRAWQEAEKESVLVGVLRVKAKEHFDWIKLSRCFYTVFTPRQGRQLMSRWLAIYSPASIRTPGAVTHLARVENIELKKRHEIETPWRPRRSADEEHVVYTLGELHELENPIQNRGPSGLGKRFSKNRWTSRLGIERATELRELFLETSAEWKLYEQLRLVDVDFTLVPGPAKLQNENDSRGRTWFVRKQYRVQYRGAAGFLIRRAGLRDQYRSDVDEVMDIFASSS
ncbi:MAG TPA: DUF2357 domain-containing protein [Pyrinomonadaceae bacterium]